METLAGKEMVCQAVPGPAAWITTLGCRGPVSSDTVITEQIRCQATFHPEHKLHQDPTRACKTKGRCKNNVSRGKAHPAVWGGVYESLRVFRGALRREAKQRWVAGVPDGQPGSDVSQGQIQRGSLWLERPP